MTITSQPYVYVASSWRTKDRQEQMVALLRDEGFGVYDFRQPTRGAKGSGGFGWSEIDEGWKQWNAEQFQKGLMHPVAHDGFRSDMNALMTCDLCVLVLPCGRSAHLELGYAIGAKKPTAIWLEKEHNEPELMYGMVGLLSTDEREIVDWLGYQAYWLLRKPVSTWRGGARR